MMKHLVIVVGFLLVVRPAAFGAAGDEHWDYQFGWPGTGGNDGALVMHNGLLYASGSGTSPTNVAIQVWDGEQWTAVAQIYGPPGTLVYNMAFLGDTLFVVGTFTNVNGQAITNFARWDGTTWSSVNFNGLVTALAVNGNNLYVGGAFTNAAAGGMTATNIAYWDGSTWHALGSGVGVYSGSSFGVNAIGFQNGLVYAGGLFTNCGPFAISNIAVWNGSTWAGIGGGVNNNVFAITFNNGILYAAGLFTQAGSTPAGFVAKWDGASWSALGAGLAGAGATRLAVFNGVVYAGGTFTAAGGVQATNLAAWNGAAWSAVGGGVSAAVSRLLTGGANLYVGGNFLLAGGILANGIAAWDGANWHSLGTPGRINGISSVVSTINGDGTNVFIGGATFAAAGLTNADRIAGFDGTNWFSIGTGLNSNVLAVASVGGEIYAAGLFTGDGGGLGPLAYHLAHWDGTHWSEVNNTPFASPTLLGTYGNDLLVAGYFGITGADGQDWWLTRWDGANFWSVLVYPPAATFVSMHFDNIGFSAMAVQGNDIYVSGQISVSECDSSFNNCTNSVYALHYDGSYAWPMGTGLNTNATAIAVAGNYVYFAGPNLTNAGGVTVSQIAQWDGNNWANVGGVVGRGSINALAAIGNNLYAGGSFTNIGGVTAARIAKWDGTSWSPLGSGVSSSVLALYASGNDLYVGGGLRTAGGKTSNFFARWNDQINFNIPQIAPLLATNGQFRLRLLGISGVTNIVQASTDFVTWTPILTNTAGIYDFTDPDSANYRWRFYRAVLGPLSH